MSTLTGDGGIMPPQAKVIALQAIVEDTLVKFDLLSSLKPSSTSSSGLGSDTNVLMLELINDRQAFEDGYAAAAAAAADATSSPSTTTTTTTDENTDHQNTTTVATTSQQQKDALAQKYRSTLKALQTTSLQNGVTAQHTMTEEEDAQATMRVRKEKARVAALLEQTANELILKSDCPSLRHTLNEEKTMDRQCEELTVSIHELRQGVHELQTTIDSERQTFETEGELMKREIVALKDELKGMRVAFVVKKDNQTTNNLAEYNTCKRLKHIDEKQRQVQLEGLRDQIDREQVSFTHTHDFLTRKLARVNNDTEEWRQRHEREAGVLQSEINELETEYSQLQEELAQVEAELAVEMEHKAKRDEETALYDVMTGQKNMCATRIQSLFRGFLVRKARNAMLKKNKKKKKTSSKGQKGGGSRAKSKSKKKTKAGA